MLVAFPLRYGRRTFSHLRMHEVQRSVLRHLVLERTASRSFVEKPCNYRRDSADLLRAYEPTEPRCEPWPVRSIPIKLRLMRRKLGHRGENDNDPLIQ